MVLDFCSDKVYYVVMKKRTTRWPIRWSAILSPEGAVVLALVAGAVKLVLGG
jgi:hypothetical protein